MNNERQEEDSFRGRGRGGGRGRDLDNERQEESDNFDEDSFRGRGTWRGRGRGRDLDNERPEESDNFNEFRGRGRGGGRDLDNERQEESDNSDEFRGRGIWRGRGTWRGRRRGTWRGRGRGTWRGRDLDNERQEESDNSDEFRGRGPGQRGYQYRCYSEFFPRKKDPMHSLNKDIRIGVLSNAKSNTSTFLDSLSNHLSDCPRGEMPFFFLNSLYESHSNKVCAVSNEFIAFNTGPLNYNNIWSDSIENCTKLMTLLNLRRQNKYHKSAMYGLTALLLDYAIVLIEADVDINQMTKDYLSLISFLRIPFFVVVLFEGKRSESKAVEAFKNFIQTTLNLNVTTWKGNKLNPASLVDTPCFFHISSSGKGVKSLIENISILLSSYSFHSGNYLIKTTNDSVEFLIDSVLEKESVYAGILVAGTIHEGQKLFIGPTHDGTFKPVQIERIQFKTVNVPYLECGSGCRLLMRSLTEDYKLNKWSFRRGMLLVSSPQVQICLQFEVEAEIDQNSSPVNVGHQTVIHCHVIRQTAIFVSTGLKNMQAGNKAVIKFQFVKAPEYLRIADKVLFLKGKIRGKGEVIKVYPIDEEGLAFKRTVAQVKKEQRKKKATKPANK